MPKGGQTPTIIWETARSVTEAIAPCSSLVRLLSTRFCATSIGLACRRVAFGSEDPTRGYATDCGG